jgi:hypothetical protein
VENSRIFKCPDIVANGLFTLVDGPEALGIKLTLLAQPQHKTEMSKEEVEGRA